MQLKKCKMMRYLIRAIKYLLLLSALYVALVWAMYLLGAEPQIDPWLQIEAHLRADIGKKIKRRRTEQNTQKNKWKRKL